VIVHDEHPDFVHGPSFGYGYNPARQFGKQDTDSHGFHGSARITIEFIGN